LPRAAASPFPSNSRWPAGATINIYIQNIDPAGPESRQRLFADGIERWRDELDRGYTINVMLGDPPDPPPANLVRYTWADPGTMQGGLALPALGAISGSTWERNPATGARDIFAGSGIISNRWSTGTPVERETLRNLGMHEMTHILGLADDANGVVTKSNVQIGGVMQFNQRDRAEIAALYGRRPNRQPPDVPRGRFELIGHNPGEYVYQAAFEGNEEELIDVVTFDINPSLVTGVVPPPGWLFMDPAEVQAFGPDAPFFDDYMEDGAPDPPPWELLDYLTFRSSAPIYDLTLGNPELTFTIFTAGDTTGTIWVHAGGGPQLVPGPVPEPTTALLWALPLLLVTRRRAPAMSRQRRGPCAGA